MSKSLKNFITIKDSLKTHTSRQIRFLFLLHKYNMPMDYGDGTMNQAVSIEKIFAEFFLNVKAVLRRLGLNGPQHVGDKERTILLALEDCKEKVHEALLDDFDTPTAAAALLELVRHANRYIEESNVSSSVLTSVGRYVTNMLRVFGLIPEGTEIGFPLESSSNGAGVENKEDILAPYLDAVTNFRQKVRLAAMGKDVSTVLQAADELRDTILPELGVRLEDKGSGVDVVSVWKMEDPEVLRMERARKEAEKAAKEEEKEANRRRLKEKEEKNKVSPSEMFKNQTDLYSAFDETGFPTHDAKGEPLSKKSTKRLEKEREKQKAAYEKYLASK
jgi:cysteinyl-tRNA synthetase